MLRGIWYDDGRSGGGAGVWPEKTNRLLRQGD